MTVNPVRNQPAPRRGFTLAELLVASSSASLLMGGLACALYLSGQALTPDTASLDAGRSARVLATLREDLRHATAFEELTKSAVTFRVPDRDGDGQTERLRYAWSGTSGDDLLYQYNSSAAETLLTDVRDFELTSLTRQFLAPTIFDSGGVGGSDSTGNGSSNGDASGGGVAGTGPGGGANLPPQFVAFAESQAASNVNSLVVPVPTGAVGELLIAAIATDSDTTSQLAAESAGWTPLTLEGSSVGATLGVWWKIATVEDTTFDASWSGGFSQQAYGWVMRFSGQDAAAPIHTFAVNSGRTSQPLASGVATTIDNCLVLRLGGFDDDDITAGDPGMAGHTPIAMASSNTGTGTTSGGAAYTTQTTAGATGDAQFTLTGSEQFECVTIAIAPGTP